MTEDLSEKEAAAELYKRALDRMGVIDTVWRKDGTNVVSATTHGKGVHLLNQSKDYLADIHLICETEAIRQAGNLPEEIDPDAHGCVFFNVKVEGVADDASGHGLPTHISGPAGVKIRSEIGEDLRRIAEQAGVELE